MHRLLFQTDSLKLYKIKTKFKTHAFWLLIIFFIILTVQIVGKQKNSKKDVTTIHICMHNHRRDKNEHGFAAHDLTDGSKS